MIKIKIERNGKTIFEVPLNGDWDRIIREMESEIEEFRKDLEEMTRLYKTFTNENRVKMLLDFIEERRKRFKEFLEEYKLNPKIVASNLENLRRAGLISKGGRREYYLSPLGFGAFMTAGVVLRRILRELQKGGEWRRIKVE
ncbi:hypothetical protein DRN86_02985 [Candidatus Geothermarchaeota archaeon]|nr:MAG: hypothetical protein DRN86_02985 [Candidatus Geothermarchaeota archaeon]